MVGSLSTLPVPVPSAPVASVPVLSVPVSPHARVPSPRRPLGAGGGRVRDWYENELGWATVPGTPLRLVVGRHFDVLDVPVEAGRAALRHLGAASPVAVHRDRMRLLVAAGSAEELPGLLEWLEWSAVDLDLVALGAGTLTEAPRPPFAGQAGAGLPGDGLPGARPLARGRSGSQGAAVWLRPPAPGCGTGASLPTLSAMGGDGGAPDLVRVVETVATHCHRLRLRRAHARPPAFS
ncbi:SCO3374 family protein [Streptomyces sp. NPDC006393]|uniref:SCO3374 family protein n=1 Tax=Streptomyces sp. NPDC006393 TaxID=3156763 RepID=UPI0033E19465